MTVLHPHLTSAYKLRRLRISLPLVPHLVDGPKYFRPDDLPPPEGEDLRPLSRPRVGPSWTSPDHSPPRKRAPGLRVKSSRSLLAPVKPTSA